MTATYNFDEKIVGNPA